jgi:hypothetical protein
LVDLDKPAAELTPRMLAEPGPLPLVRGEIAWCSFAACAGCGESVAVRRFARPGAEVGRCRCGRTLEASPLGLFATLPADDLRACIDTPLSQLGLPDGTAVGVSPDGEDWAYFFPATEATRGH